jgi:hypothetical protein
MGERTQGLFGGAGGRGKTLLVPTIDARGAASTAWQKRTSGLHQAQTPEACEQAAGH